MFWQPQAANSLACSRQSLTVLYGFPYSVAFDLVAVELATPIQPRPMAQSPALGQKKIVSGDFL